MSVGRTASRRAFLEWIGGSTLALGLGGATPTVRMGESPLFTTAAGDGASGVPKCRVRPSFERNITLVELFLWPFAGRN